ncbi:MAG: Holliday junction resolvase RuvX [Oscillospiraceae bacterium]|nr:Holliday junction resolvase RuvX [Oscillospiraceae bacterium]
MRIMAIDYGDARTGIAVSDLTGSIAGEAFVVEERDAAKLAERIAAEAQTREAATVILGYPKNMDGSLGARAEKSGALAELLRGLGLSVVLWDERRTTIAAHDILSANNRHGKRRKQTVDAVAATLILEGYLASAR